MGLPYIPSLKNIDAIQPIVETNQAFTQSWPTPTTIQEVQGILALSEGWSRFIPAYPEIIESLSDLVNSELFYWGEREQQSFDNLVRFMDMAGNMMIDIFNDINIDDA